MIVEVCELCFEVVDHSLTECPICENFVCQSCMPVRAFGCGACEFNDPIDDVEDEA